MFSGGDEDPMFDTHEMIVTVGTVFVGLIKIRDVFPEGLLALLTDESHFRRLCEPVRLGFCVAFGTIEPLLAAGRTDRNLSVQDVLATVFQRRYVEERPLDASPHVVGARSNLKGRGSHAYNAWQSTLGIPPEQNTRLI